MVMVIIIFIVIVMAMGLLAGARRCTHRHDLFRTALTIPSKRLESTVCCSLYIN